MTYCGYVDYLMVFMFSVVLMLCYILLCCLMLLLMNFDILVVSCKIFNVNFFGDWELILNIWSILFLFMVLIISTSVMIFSFSYMSGFFINNFIILYLSFIISMVWLILNNNFYWMMFGWDGLGVVSFLLIIFYMNNESINNGLFTLFQNRIGDLFFVFFMLGILQFSMYNNLIIFYGLFFLICGASVKSAQFPFNSWLLSAMSAPTPISSLVHSSTLVVAGVYILLQFSYCLIDVLEILKFISVLTLMLSSFGLLNEGDMKKLIAYSTMSHVSLMLFMLSYKLYKIVYFHLNIHAMFKSLMFMCFGFVMLVSYHSQDKRLVTFMFLNPLIKMIYFFSCLCLAGLPFLSGFFSKDFMIEKMMENNGSFFFIISLLMFLSLSIYYSMKLLFLSSVLFSFQLLDKSNLGMLSVMMMTFVMIIIINLYISLVFSLSLEFVSNKLGIYILVLIFFLLSILTNCLYKFNVYDKIMNFKEMWFVNFHILDQFSYMNIIYFMSYMSVLSNVKLFLLMNWWMLILIVVLF